MVKTITAVAIVLALTSCTEPAGRKYKPPEAGTCEADGGKWLHLGVDRYLQSIRICVLQDGKIWMKDRRLG